MVFKCIKRSVVVVDDAENGACRGGFDKVRIGSRLKCDSEVSTKRFKYKSERTDDSQGMSWFPFVSSLSFLDE